MVETRRHRLIRYAIVAAIVIVIGGLLAREQLASDDDDDAVAVGLLDELEAAEGELAPDFVLRTLDGGQARLSDYRGKTVVLNFWASWCPPCREEMPEFQELWEQRGADGSDDLVILAVDRIREDSEGAVEGFTDEVGVTFPVLFDTAGGDVEARYRVLGLPATYFIDRDGVIRARNLGPVFGDLLPDGVAAADAAGESAASRSPGS